MAELIPELIAVMMGGLIDGSMVVWLMAVEAFTEYYLSKLTKNSINYCVMNPMDSQNHPYIQGYGQACAAPEVSFNRFFLELPPDAAELKLTNRHEKMHWQKARAVELVSLLQGWLIESRLSHQVRQLNVTLLGQIQIVCTAEVIDIIRQQDVVPFAAIRSARENTERLSIPRGSLTE